MGLPLEPFVNRGFSFTILHWSGNKDCFTDKFTSLHRGIYKSSAPSFKDFEDIPSKPGAFDVSRQAKMFLRVSKVALHSSIVWQFLSIFM